MSTNVYPSKIDTWLILACASSLLATMGVTLPLLIWLPGREAMLTVALLLLGTAFPFWILGSTSYTVTDECLAIRSGPFRWQLPLADIVSITPTRSPWSSPALSLDRLRVDRRGGRPILISPKHREKFFADLASRGVVGLPAQ